MSLLPDWVPDLWRWVTTISDWNTPEGWLARIVIWSVTVYLLLLLLKNALELAAKANVAWKDLGLPTAASLQHRLELRRKCQFSRVLASDLTSLAKAENWNDQFFTDLEAEIEVDGRYYATALDRMIRRESVGLRRLPSLMRAIQTSTEQFLVLVGEPGSGKSVALRHLALQLATEAARSTDIDAPIPLYINLREFGHDATPMTAQIIRAFVIDNIRRGDADTASYVQEHWDDYRDRGIWYFLFDSFDEIPAVLHAATGAHAISEHAEALRQFVTSMGDCRAIIASREFKGPSSLPWHRLRILPLSAIRQDTLIDNSFLSTSLKSIARQHVASTSSSLLNNPLFLTLLCRYVKEEGKAPTHDHDLLSRHIARLSERDPDYMSRRYGLTPAQLLDGATSLAVAFAEDDSLSLSPTLDQLNQAASLAQFDSDKLELLLAALVDTKIGRSDVQEARAGDRRFAFSHRRYQETLFVKYLAEHPEHIAPHLLLTDLRWREYTVTLLQTQPIRTLNVLLEAAELLLADCANRRPTSRILDLFGGHLSYTDWSRDAVHLILATLQEGLSRRLTDVPNNLRNRVESVVAPRWRNGDIVDLTIVLALGALSSPAFFSECIRYAIERGSEEMRALAFRGSVMLPDLPADLGSWIRERLSEQLLLANTKQKVHRLEALAKRLPDSVGADHVVGRCGRIRRIVRLFVLAAQAQGRILARVFPSPRRSEERRLAFAFTSAQLLILYVPLLVASAVLRKPFHGLALGRLEMRPSLASAPLLAQGLAVSCLVIIAAASVFLWTLFVARAVGMPLGIRAVAHWFRSLSWIAVKNVMRDLALPIGAVLAMFVPGALYLGVIAVFPGILPRFALIAIFIVSFAVCFAGLFGWLVFDTAIKARRQAARLRTVSRSHSEMSSTLLEATSLGELYIWLTAGADALLRSAEEGRSFSRLLLSEPRRKHDGGFFDRPLFQTDWGRHFATQGDIQSVIARRLGELEAFPPIVGSAL